MFSYPFFRSPTLAQLRRLKAEEEEIQAHAARKGGSRRTPGSGRKRRKNTKRGHGDWDRDLTFKPKVCGL